MTPLSAEFVQGGSHGRAIEGKLRRAWHKERRYSHLRGLCHLLVWIVAFIAVDFFVDYMFQMPRWGASP